MIGTSLVLIVSIELNIRSGIIEAYEHKLYMSAPEYPRVSYESSFLSYSLKLNDMLSVRLFINCFRPSKFGKGMYSRFTNRRRTASSSYCGKLVAPIMRTRSSLLVLAPSSSTKNSVFTLLELYCYPSFLEHNNESISSINITLGCFNLAIVNKVFTNF